MRALVGFLCLILLLPGCSRQDRTMEDALAFRDRLLKSKQCCFTAKICADYGDVVQTFSLETGTDQNGVMIFRVIAPESIEGISGSVGQEGAALTFDDQVLLFPMLAQGRLSPAAAPWVLINALRSGYISSAAREAEGVRLSLKDSLDENGIVLDVWFDEAWNPIQCRIYDQGTDVVAFSVEDFTLL